MIYLFQDMIQERSLLSLSPPCRSSTQHKKVFGQASQVIEIQSPTHNPRMPVSQSVDSVLVLKFSWFSDLAIAQSVSAVSLDIVRLSLVLFSVSLASVSGCLVERNVFMATDRPTERGQESTTTRSPTDR
eukprot:Selendium_serpulae@DN6514_c3_g1_i1.p1